MMLRTALYLTLTTVSLAETCPVAATDPEIPRWGHNLLLDAKVSGNLRSFRKGLRGTPDHVIYDLDGHTFFKTSE